MSGEESPGAEKKAAVFGANGYGGTVASELLWHHPEFGLVAVTSRNDAGKRLDEVPGNSCDLLRGIPFRLEHPDAILENADDGSLDYAVVAYPHGEAAPVVAALRSYGTRVVDLSADFRLRDRDTYEQWYGPHQAPELLESGEAVYGLTELYREDVRDAELVANPGCYPTATVLALAPLAEQGLIEDVSVKAYSGISGAGKEGAEQYRGASERIIEYGQDGHRHQPEIEQELAALGYHGTLKFQPHVMPDVFEGLLTRCYVTPSRSLDTAELHELYRDEYRDEPFMHVSESPLEIGDARRTNLCRINLTAGHDGQICITAVIDNLWKGAAGQAVQNLNLQSRMPEKTGLW